MSPIRPDQRARYPKDWPAISAEIRHERAGDRCECDGRCGSAKCIGYIIGRLYEAWALSPLVDLEMVPPPRCTAVNGQPHPYTGSRVVLTVAHLDHQPENCDPDNLLALCQACHLAYDAGHHAETRRNRIVYETTTQEEP